MRKRIVSMLLMAVLLCVQTAFAAGTGSIKVNFPEGYPVDKAELVAYRVADWNGVPTEAFAGADVDLTALNTAEQKRETASRLQVYADQNRITGMKLSEQGTLNGLENGVYLLAQTNSVPSYSMMAATLVKVYENSAGESSSTQVDPKVEKITNAGGGNITSVSVKKVWDDNNDADQIRPASVTITLLADGQDTGKKATLSASTNWSHTFSELPTGRVYTVQEKAVAGYTATIAGDATVGFTVTNRHTPVQATPPASGTKELAVTKKWEGDTKENRPASITIRLLDSYGQNGSTLLLNEANNWSGKFTGLDAGKSYTIAEDAVSGYKVSYSKSTDGWQWTVTNTKTTGTDTGTGTGTGTGTNTGTNTGTSTGTNTNTGTSTGTNTGTGTSTGTSTNTSTTANKKIPQTGQLNWPVPILIGCGIACILGGGVLSRRDRRRDQEQ